MRAFTIAWLYLFPWISHADDLLPPMTNGVPSEYAPRRSGAEVGADRRISVTNEGLYRITHATLLNAGITNPVGSELRLFCRTQEIALAVSSEGTWSTNDFAVFYGWPHDGYWTVTNTYWLGFGGSGLRMTSRNAAPQLGWPERTTRVVRVLYENKSIYVPTYRPTDGSFDHWISHNIFTNATNLFISTPYRVPAGTATVHLALWGRTSSIDHDPDHATRFTINGQAAQTSRYDGMVFHLGTNLAAQSVLSNGMNTVQLRQAFTGANDVASLEWLSIAYEASNTVVGGRLSFPGQPISNNYAASPWNTNDAPWLLDISNPYKPVQLVNYQVDTLAGTGRVRWADFAFGTNRYWLASPTTLMNSAISSPVLFREFSNISRQADYIVISHGLLATGAYQLAKHRSRDGLRTLMVPIESVYDEFSYGIKDARAIKQFLGYAYHHWATAPRFALLVGDGSYDPKNYYSIASPLDLIPVYLDAAPFEYCVQDNWYGTVDGSDLLPDVLVGRLPMTTSAQVTSAVAKIVGFEQAPTHATWRKKALLVADDNDGTNNFKAASESDVRPYLATNGFTLTTSYLDDQPGGTAINRAVVTNAINAGTWAVSYFGHGGPTLWGTGFDTGHVAQLQNINWPIFTVMTCDNGAFANPTNECMAEVLLERNQRGASATLSASALSLQVAAAHYAEGFYRHFTNALPRTRLGDAIQSGLAELWSFSPNSQELLFYNLFGDPAQVLTP